MQLSPIYNFLGEKVNNKKNPKLVKRGQRTNAKNEKIGERGWLSR